MGLGRVVDGACVDDDDPGTVVPGIELEVSESGVVLDVGTVVVIAGAAVVSLVDELEHDTAISDAANARPNAW